jgi:predicted DNA-binding ArsR family transcriptional regulator
MKTYSMDNYEDLYDSFLKENDKVIFIVNGKYLVYTVRDNHLSKSGVTTNSTIFELLDLDKYKYCSEKYRYNTESGSWPYYKYKDFNAATNLVLALFELCDIRELEKESKEDEEIELYDSEEDEEIDRKNKTPEKLSDKLNLSTNIKSENENGKIIKTQRVTPSVVRGEKRRGHTVQGKNSRTAITGGHLGYRTITG